jgi:energy-coupling factor transporter ATP-binding protein EcfA2
MLTRLYADNFRCLVNFEFRPQQTQLLMGRNGVGKSSVLDLLTLLRAFVEGEGRTADLFGAETLTRWQTRNVQTFEMRVEGNGGKYAYKLQIEHEVATGRCRVSDETLAFDGRPLFQFRHGDVQLYRDDFSLGPTFHFDWELSGLGAIGARQDNQRLIWFRSWMHGVQTVRLNAFGMTARSEREDARPRTDMSNFASWYRHLVQEMPELLAPLQESLRDLWDGFESLRLEKAGENVRLLKVRIRSGVGSSFSGVGTPPAEYSLDELSDGYRALLVIHTLLQFAIHSENALLCIDEPVNFVALAEIQPWLTSLVEAAEDHGFHVILVSHHPELVNFFAPESAVVLDRLDGGPTRVVDFVTEPGLTLTPAEVVARGWEHA